jgi:hypothetical protein
MSDEERFRSIFGMTEEEMAEQVHQAVWGIAERMPPTSLCTCESMGGRYGAHRSACPWQQAFEEQLAAEERAALGDVCPGTKFPDGTHCGEYGWHASDCPERTS